MWGSFSVFSQENINWLSGLPAWDNKEGALLIGVCFWLGNKNWRCQGHGGMRMSVCAQDGYFSRCVWNSRLKMKGVGRVRCWSECGREAVGSVQSFTQRNCTHLPHRCENIPPQGWGLKESVCDQWIKSASMSRSQVNVFNLKPFYRIKWRRWRKEAHKCDRLPRSWTHLKDRGDRDMLMQLYLVKESLEEIWPICWTQFQEPWWHLVGSR